MRNAVSYYQLMMQRSLPLKITVFLLLISFPLSIVFTIVCLCLHCSYSTYYHSCSYLVYNNPYECYANGNVMCCGLDGSMSCQGYYNCVIKPSVSNQSLCQGMVITSWVLYFVFLISTIVFFVLHRKIAPQVSEDYARLNNDIEIANQRNNVPSNGNNNQQRTTNSSQIFVGQGLQIGSSNDQSFSGQGQQIGNSLL